MDSSGISQPAMLGIWWSISMILSVRREHFLPRQFFVCFRIPKWFLCFNVYILHINIYIYICIFIYLFIHLFIYYIHPKMIVIICYHHSWVCRICFQLNEWFYPGSGQAAGGRVLIDLEGLPLDVEIFWQVPDWTCPLKFIIVIWFILTIMVLTTCWIIEHVY